MDELDNIRVWILRQPAPHALRALRLHLFDLYRYSEEYEKIYEMVQDLIKN